MQDGTDHASSDTPSGPNRYANSGPGCNAEATYDDTHWLNAAFEAKDIRQLYDAARGMQAAGLWNDHHAAWFRVARAKLGLDERVTVLQLALLERELGAVPADGVAS